MCVDYRIRPARIDEASLLTDVALRSKAHWGYSPEFMAAARQDLIVTPGQLAVDTIFVLEQGGEVLGFYKLRAITPDVVEMTDLFLDPTAIGQGKGRALWEHAVTIAATMGYKQIVWESDPNAEGFYLRMGAVRVGEIESTVQPGRFLPRMSYTL
jgi:ribosomal protein S18 acetylase RimI-like enzyme